MESSTFDLGHESGYISLHGSAFGEALSHESPAAEARDAGSTARMRSIRGPVERPQRHSDEPNLTVDEQALLRVFVARRGQCLSVSTLERAFAAAREEQDRPASATRAHRGSEDLNSLITSLSAKLRESGLKWRVVAMDGCGYILWH